MRGILLTVAVVTATLGACYSTENENPGDGSSVTAKPKDAGFEGGVVIAAGLCGRLGGDTGIDALAGDVLTRFKSDCRISANFTGLDANNTAHVTQCVAQEIRRTGNCLTGEYKDKRGQNCGTLFHVGQNYREADFFAGLDAIAAALPGAGATADDVLGVRSAFLLKKTAQQFTPGVGNVRCTCPGGMYMGTNCLAPVPPTDAGTDASTTTDGGSTTDSGSGSDAGDGG